MTMCMACGYRRPMCACTTTMNWWAITDEDGKTHIKQFLSKSAAVKWCTRDLERDCRGCRPATPSEIAGRGP